MFERMSAAELLQGPVVLTFLIARNGLDLGFETEGCAAERARAFIVCVPGYLHLCFVKMMKRVRQMHRHEEAHVGAIVVCRRALVT